jgi:hypothetical protein
MRESLDGDCLDKWIGDDYFFFAERGWVAVESSFGISSQQIANAGQAA